LGKFARSFVANLHKFPLTEHRKQASKTRQLFMCFLLAVASKTRVLFHMFFALIRIGNKKVFFMCFLLVTTSETKGMATEKENAFLPIRSSFPSPEPKSRKATVLFSYPSNKTASNV